MNPYAIRDPEERSRALLAAFAARYERNKQPVRQRMEQLGISIEKIKENRIQLEYLMRKRKKRRDRNKRWLEKFIYGLAVGINFLQSED